MSGPRAPTWNNSCLGLATSPRSAPCCPVEYTSSSPSPLPGGRLFPWISISDPSICFFFLKGSVSALTHLLPQVPGASSLKPGSFGAWKLRDFEGWFSFCLGIRRNTRCSCHLSSETRELVPGVFRPYVNS